MREGNAMLREFAPRDADIENIVDPDQFESDVGKV